MKNMLSRKAALAIAFTLHVASGGKIGLANLLLNPSFEEPQVTKSVLLINPGPIGPGWQTSTLVLLFRSGALDGPVTRDGGQYLGLGASIIFQDVELAPFSPHRLVFDLSGDNEGPRPVTGIVRVDILRNGTSLLGGERIFSTSGRSFDAKEIVFNSLDAGTYQLLVSNSGGEIAYVDAFNLVAVPEPSSILLLGLSVVGLSSSRRLFR